MCVSVLGMSALERGVEAAFPGVAFVHLLNRGVICAIAATGMMKPRAVGSVRRVVSGHRAPAAGCRPRQRYKSASEQLHAAGFSLVGLGTSVGNHGMPGRPAINVFHGTTRSQRVTASWQQVQPGGVGHVGCFDRASIQSGVHVGNRGMHNKRLGGASGRARLKVRRRAAQCDALGQEWKQGECGVDGHAGRISKSIPSRGADAFSMRSVACHEPAYGLGLYLVQFSGTAIALPNSLNRGAVQRSA